MKPKLHEMICKTRAGDISPLLLLIPFLVIFQMPNQKLPFLKEDFYVKNSYADFEIDTVETQIILYNDNNVSIYFNHNRFIRGNISENGELIPVDNTLNTKEQQLFDENSNEIERILKQLFVIHNSVYSV